MENYHLEAIMGLPIKYLNW